MKWWQAAACALMVALLLTAPAAAQVNDPPIIVDAFERARTGQDVDAAMGLFADDATVTVQDQQTQQLTAFTGKDQIRGFLAVQVARSVPQVTSSRHVVGNTVTWTERDAADLVVEAVVLDGKIRSIAYRPATLSPSHMAGGIPVPLLAASVVATTCLLAIGLRTLLARRSALLLRPASRRRGQLLRELDVWRVARRGS